jgi:hypothetical protein
MVIIGHHFVNALKKHPAVHGPVQDLRQGEFGLQDRDRVTIASLAVGRRERMR